MTNASLPNARPAPVLRMAIAALAVVTAGCGRQPAQPAAPTADLVISGAPIHTGVPGQAPAQAVAVLGDRVLAVGSLVDIKPLIGPQTEEIRLEGGALFPGFVDSHAHLIGVGFRELTLNLEGVGSIEELVEIVAAQAAETAPGDVIYGRGWIETGWPEGRFPNRDDLDAASPRNPTILERADGHALVANSAALLAAGVTDATPDPTGGRIERDARGRATGMLIDNAMALVERIIPEPDEARRREALIRGGQVYAAYGWTGLHNMSVAPGDLALIEALSDEGSLALRVYNAVDGAGLAALVASGPRANANGRVVTRAVKLYMDGALGSRGAALDEPYADQPDTRGLLLLSDADTAAALDQAAAAGLQVAMHAIGDRANRLALDAFAAAFARHPARADPRWRIEHAQVLAPADIPRFRALGVIASMQPSHAIGDLFFAPARLGDRRLDGAYAWRSLLDAGAIIAGGSDAPVERGDPAIEFYAAVARRSLDGVQGPDWRAGQRVTRAEALAMFTSAPAYAAFMDRDLGMIAPGALADFSAFSVDLMAAPEAELPNARAVLTVIGGKVAYRAEPDELRRP